MTGSPPAEWENADVTILAKKTPYLVRKGDRFYFRVRIPQDLREVIGSEALGDVNKAQAEVLAAQHGQERFLRERYTLGTASAPPAEAPQPGDQQLDTVSREFIAVMIESRYLSIPRCIDLCAISGRLLSDMSKCSEQGRGLQPTARLRMRYARRKPCTGTTWLWRTS